MWCNCWHSKRKAAVRHFKKDIKRQILTRYYGFTSICRCLKIQFLFLLFIHWLVLFSRRPPWQLEYCVNKDIRVVWRLRLSVWRNRFTKFTWWPYQLRSELLCVPRHYNAFKMHPLRTTPFFFIRICILKRKSLHFLPNKWWRQWKKSSFGLLFGRRAVDGNR